MYNKFRPGRFWYDTNGKLIQAHGGAVIFAEGKYWWYGENKEGVTGFATGESCKIRQHGWKLYSSNDLYNWTDEGFIMAENTEEGHIFNPSNIGDRPHVLYNAKTGLYVLWIKTAKGRRFEQGQFSICVGKSLKSMKYVKSISPTPHFTGDFDLFETDGKAYVIFEHPHTHMVCRELNDDYTDLTDVYSEHLFLGTPPFVREAPAFFERNGRKYLLTSGTTSYFPNPTIGYDITDIHGEWKDLGITCVNDINKNSFNAQFASVFKHPTIEDLYIAIGDRWLVDCALDLPDMEKVFIGDFAPDRTDGIKIPYAQQNTYTDRNTSLATYVWLPISFDGDGAPRIHWQREWCIEDKE